jgi:hypothetical protein
VIGDTAWQPMFVLYMGYALRLALAGPGRRVEMVLRQQRHASPMHARRNPLVIAQGEPL